MYMLMCACVCTHMYVYVCMCVCVSARVCTYTCAREVFPSTQNACLTLVIQVALCSYLDLGVYEGNSD